MAVIRILGTIALKGVLSELEPQIRSRTGHDLTYVWGPTGTVYEHSRAGEAHDVLIAVPAAIDTMIAEGHAVAGSRADVARSVIGIAVKADGPHPDISTVEGVKRAVAAARAVAYTDPSTQAASGLHVARLLEDWGMTDAVNANAVYGHGGPVAEYLVDGRADLAIQQLCEHKLVAGVDVVGPVPDEIQLVSTMSVALGSRAAAQDAARALIATLVAPGIHPVLMRHGLYPPDDGRGDSS